MSMTQLDLNTLGNPSNDSEALNCYISEKGVQAVPSFIDGAKVGLKVGKYWGSFNLDSKKYFIFEDTILNEELEFALAYFHYFDEDGLFHEADSVSASFDGDYFLYDVRGFIDTRPIKAISYMTITNQELTLYDISTNTSIIRKVKNNTLAIISANVIAFIDEKTDELNLVKNPIFGEKNKNTELDLISPFGIYAIRSYFPVRIRVNGRYGSDMGGLYSGERGNFPLTMQSEVPIKNPNNIYLKVADGPSAYLKESGDSRINNPPGPYSDQIFYGLREETVFIYDKQTRKIKAAHQVRLRGDYDTDVTTRDTIDPSRGNTIKPINVQIRTTIFEYNGLIHSYNPYIRTLLVFSNDINTENLNIDNNIFYNEEFSNDSTAVSKVWLDSFYNQLPDVNRNRIFNNPDVPEDTLPFSFFRRYTSVVGAVRDDTEGWFFPYLLYYTKSSIDNLDQGILNPEYAARAYGIFKTEDTEIGEKKIWMDKKRYQCRLLTKDSDIDEVIGNVVNFYDPNNLSFERSFAIIDDIDTTAPRVIGDNNIEFGSFSNTDWLRSFMRVYPAFAAWEIYDSATIVTGDGEDDGLIDAFRAKYLYSLRSRLFSIKTEIFSQIFPFAFNGNSSLTVDKFPLASSFGNTEKPINDWMYSIFNYDGRYSAYNFLLDEQYFQLKNILPIEGQNIILKNSRNNSDLFLYRMFDWPEPKREIGYTNAVYYTRISQFAHEEIDEPYFVPSNISAEIFGLFGTDRNIYAISDKGIEEFNIADSADVPVSFNRVFKIYDRLIDFSYINNNLDILYKNLNSFFFNDIQRIKEIYTNDSRIAPDTTYKQINFKVIDNQDHWRIFDSENREFKIDKDKAMHSLTNKNNESWYTSDKFIKLASTDTENFNTFRISWYWRPEKTEMLRKIAINTSEYEAWNTQDFPRAKMFKLWKNLGDDDILVGERFTNQYTTSFFKIGRMNSVRLILELNGYLKSIEMHSTGIHQK